MDALLEGLEAMCYYPTEKGSMERRFQKELAVKESKYEVVDVAALVKKAEIHHV